MFEPFVALLRFVQAAFELAVASDAQVGVLLVGALGAAAVAIVVLHIYGLIVNRRKKV